MGTTEMQRLVVRLQADLSQYATEMKRAGSMLNTLASNAKKAGDTIARSVKLMTGMAAATVTAAGAWGLKLAANAEQNQVAFEVMLGNAQKAQQLTEELRQFAASTPFELPGITAAARSLLAFGVEAKDIQSEMKRIGDIASGVNMPLEELAELYGKAKVQGRLFAEDLNQLTGRGIPIIQELASQFGVAESEVRKLVEEGQFGFSNLQQAFAKLTSEGGRFGGMMERQSQTLAGRFSTLKDEVNTAMQEMGTALMVNFDLAGVVRNLTSFLQFFRNSWQDVLSYVGQFWTLKLVQMANDIAFFFNQQLWPLIQLYPKWWWETFQVVLKNAAEFGSALWRAVKGEGWEMHWQGYSEAFLKEVQKIPQLADRPMTQFEKQTSQELERLADRMGKQWQSAFLEPPKAKAPKAQGPSLLQRLKDQSKLAMGFLKTEFGKFAALNPPESNSFRVNQALRGDTMEGMQARQSTSEFVNQRPDPAADPAKLQLEQRDLTKTIAEGIGKLVKMQSSANRKDGLQFVKS
jgi:tape measure domain-containing protein